MKVTLVLDVADAERLAWLADVGARAALRTGDNRAGDAALVERVKSARPHFHRGEAKRW